MLIGVAGMLGWILGLQPLISVVPGFAAIKFNAALGLTLAGAGLLMLPTSNAVHTFWKILPALTMGGFSTILGTIALAEYGFMALNLDESLVAVPITIFSSARRMAVPTAVGIASAGAAIVLLSKLRTVQSTRTIRRVILAHLLALVPTSIGYLSLAGYAYNVDGLYKFDPFSSIAIHTAIGLLLLGLAILLTAPGLGWLRLFADRPVALGVWGRLLPLSLVIPFLAGLTVIQGVHHHVYDARFGPPLLALVTAAASIGLAWIAAIEVRAAEGYVSESKAQLRSLVDTAADGIVLADSDGQIRAANQAMLRMFGYDSIDELIGRNLGVLMPVAEAARHGGYVAARRPNAKPRVIGVPGRELLAIRRDRSQFPIDLSVSSFDFDGGRFLTGIIRDATARKRAEAARAEAEARFRGIFDSQFQYISLLSTDGTILEVNRTALDVCRLTRDKAIGKPLWEGWRWPEADCDQLRADIAEAAQGRMIRREAEFNCVGGRTIPIDLSLNPVRDETTGTITLIIAEGRDQSEKHTLATRLAQAQKVQALGQLSAGIAHDFNNILQAVAGAAALIERHPGDQERTQRLARAAMTAAERGASIVQRLLSFARHGELRIETIAPAEVLTDVREVLVRTLGTTITVCTHVAPGTSSMIADRAQLETALINLATNARDAMPSGGKLILSADAGRVDEGEHHPAGPAPGMYVRLNVTDNGTGMDAATLARVGEPFFTTKAQGKGTGLGLAMAKGFAEQSGGGLSITSKPGSGTTVTIWLRQATAAIHQADDHNHATNAAPTAWRVMVIDDDDLVREVVAAQLETEGFATLVASSGREALALLDAGEVVDALVSDLSMPDMNGVTVIQKARALRPGLRCLLLTGYIGERPALSEQNTFTLVRKPVAARALAAQIKATLAGMHGEKTQLVKPTAVAQLSEPHDVSDEQSAPSVTPLRSPREPA